MPIYEYRCEDCDACFEQLVFGSEEQDIQCPSCGADRVHRQMSCVSAAGKGRADKCAGGSGFT